MSLELSTIAFIDLQYDTGGVDDTRALAKALAQAGHRVDVFARRSGPDLPESTSPFPGVRVFNVAAGPAEPQTEDQIVRHVPAFVDAVLAHWRAETRCDDMPRYGLMHAHRLLSGLAAQRLKEESGVPFATSLESLVLVNGDENGTDPIRHLRADIERRVIAHADMLLADCPAQCHALASHYGVDEARVAVIPTCVDAERFRPHDRLQSRMRLDLDPADFLVAHVGPITATSGVDNVIRALGRLGSSVRARLLVIGQEHKADDERRITEVAHESGVSQQVRLIRSVKYRELPVWLAASDVLVDTSWFEPDGAAILDAMGSGIPVIASDTETSAYTVVDGVTGFLVRPRDPLGLAGRLEHLHGNPALAGALGHAGALRARSVFSARHVAESLADAYHQIRENASSEAGSASVLDNDVASAAHRPTGLQSWQLRADPLPEHVIQRMS